MKKKQIKNFLTSGLDSIPGVEEEESVKEEAQSVERTASPVTADENDEFLPKRYENIQMKSEVMETFIAREPAHI